MKIDFYCSPDSPSFRFHPRDLWGRGLGGAELSLISLAETLAARGHLVTVYHQPPEAVGNVNGVYYLSTTPFYPGLERDAFVLFRNPMGTCGEMNALEMVNARAKLFWSCDQVSAGNYATDVYPYVDQAILISEFHRQDHHARYNIPLPKMTVIDLGVRLQDYAQPLPKQPGKLIFCAVPHRGLTQLSPIYRQLKERHPEVELHITADYTLWGPGIPPSDADMRTLFAAVPGVHYHGAIPRSELITHQLTSDLYVYPHYPVSGFPELFGISVAECMAAACVPLVSQEGALHSTTGDGGYALIGDPRQEDAQQNYVNLACFLLEHRAVLTDVQQQARQIALARFNWDNIAAIWEQTIEKIIQGDTR